MALTSDSGGIRVRTGKGNPDSVGKEPLLSLLVLGFPCASYAQPLFDSFMMITPYDS